MRRKKCNGPGMCWSIKFPLSRSANGKDHKDKGKKREVSPWLMRAESAQNGEAKQNTHAWLLTFFFLTDTAAAVRGGGNQRAAVAALGGVCNEKRRRIVADAFCFYFLVIF